MDLDEHARHLGGLVANLQSLEFLIRIYLTTTPGARPLGISPGIDIYQSPIGCRVPESDLTSFDSLGDLISKFNAAMVPQGKRTLDMSLVDLRDALAHGRVSANVADEHLRLIKFDRPKNGFVLVTFNEEMTESWFSSQKAFVFQAMQLVYKEWKGGDVAN